MKKFFLIFAAAIIALTGFSGCRSTELLVDLEALAVGKDPKNYVYQVLPGDASIDVNDLKYQRLKYILEESLLNAGLNVTDNTEKATAQILFTATISEPNKQVAGMTGGVSFSNATFGGTVVTNNTNKYMIYETNYMRHVFLDTYELDKSKKRGPKIWTLDVLSEGGSNDLQNLLNYFSKAMELFYGQDSNGRRKIILEIDDDGSVTEISEK